MGRFTQTSTTLALVSLLALSACSSIDDSSSEASADTVGPAMEAPVDDLGDAPSSGAALDGEQPTELSTAGSNAPSAPLDLDRYGRAIAIEAGIQIGTSNIRRAVDDTLAVVARNNASVYTADVNIGTIYDDGSIDGSGHIVVKVPPTDLDPLIAELDGTAGTLIGRTQSSDDVTEQLVDLDVRIGVERSTITQFEALLAEATQFDDIVTIQRVLSEHTVTLEQLLASQRNVDQRVELSTLTIDLTYMTPTGQVADTPAADDGVADALGRGWDAFAGAAMAILIVLAVAAPFLALALLVFGTVWLVARRSSARRARRAIEDRRRHEGFDPPTSAPASDEVLVGSNREV